MARFGALRDATTIVDGITLAFAEWGAADGRAVVGWPGNPGSRFGLGWAREWAAACGVRLVIFDRPGMGGSEPDSSRSVTSTARRVTRAVADLGIARFAVLGNSSGGPYALACAAVAPAAVARVAVVAGVGVMSETGAHDGMSEENGRFWSQASVGPSATTETFQRIIGDAPTMGLHPEKAADIAEAGRQGAFNLALDAHVITARWDVELTDVTAPVDLWHGAVDDDVPLIQARRLADRLRQATLHVWPNRGHDMPPEAMLEVYALLGCEPTTPTG